MITENNNQVSVVLTEPEAALFADAVNLVGAINSGDELFIEMCTKQILSALYHRFYNKETMLSMLEKVRVVADHYLKSKR